MSVYANSLNVRNSSFPSSENAFIHGSDNAVEKHFGVLCSYTGHEVWIEESKRYRSVGGNMEWVLETPLMPIENNFKSSKCISGADTWGVLLCDGCERIPVLIGCRLKLEVANCFSEVGQWSWVQFFTAGICITFLTCTKLFIENCKVESCSTVVYC